MKKFGFMLMAVAVVAMSMVSCDKKPDDNIIVNPPVPQDELKLPNVTATDGAITVVIKFDEAPCEGYDVLFVGNYAGLTAEWDFAAARAMESIGDGWYKIVVAPNDGADIYARPIQGKDGAAEWSYDWSHSGADLIRHKGASDDIIGDSGFGEINLHFTQAHADEAVVVFLESKKWNVAPCAAAETYSLTLTAPEFCGEEYTVEVVGSFEGWGTNPVAMTKNGNVYTAQIQAKSGDEIKFRGHVTDPDMDPWAVQILGLNQDENSEDYDTMMEMPNQKLGDEKNVTFQWSDPEIYAWNICYVGI